MQEPLTEAEENFLKDVLKFVSNEPSIRRSMAIVFKLTDNEFDKIADKSWEKLQNGRLTIITE